MALEAPVLGVGATTVGIPVTATDVAAALQRALNGISLGSGLDDVLTRQSRIIPAGPRFPRSPPRKAA